MDFSQLTCTNFLQTLDAVLPAHWSRSRGSLPPNKVFFTIMHMVGSSLHGYRNVLDHLRRSVGDYFSWDDTPAASSLSEARRKLSKEQCRAVFHATRASCIGLARFPHKVCYRDYRLLAADMTTVALPPYRKVACEFGYPKDRTGGQAGSPQATLTALWDLSTNTPIDWLLERVYSSEQLAAHKLLEHVGEGDLIICDRGYPSRRFFQEVVRKNAAFLVRMRRGRAGTFKEVNAFFEDEAVWDQEILLHETNARIGDPTIRVRLMKHRLPSGDIAVFATNLFGVRKHHRRALCELYCYRWDIETAFKEMKSWHALENLHARYAEGIHQEVCALMTFMLLNAEMEAQARGFHNLDPQQKDNAVSPQAPQEPEYRFNRKQIAESMMYILAAGLDGPEAVEKEIVYCMKQFWRYRQRRRPGRSFERSAKDPNSKYKKSTYNANKKVKKAKSLAE